MIEIVLTMLTMILQLKLFEIPESLNRNVRKIRMAAKFPPLGGVRLNVRKSREGSLRLPVGD